MTSVYLVTGGMPTHCICNDADEVYYDRTGKVITISALFDGEENPILCYEGFLDAGQGVAFISEATPEMRAN